LALTEWGRKTPGLNSTERGSPRAAIHLGPAALYLVALFVGGLIPDGGPPAGMSDKTLHATAFGLFVPFAGWATRFVTPNAPLRRRVVLAAIASSVAGALLEYWQAFVPYRDADFLDWVADTFGAAVIAALWFFAAQLVGVFRSHRTAGAS
jgi:hypothetical protein